VRYDQNCMLVFMYSARYSCQILMKLEFSQHIFEIYSNYKFHENSSSVRQVVPCGRTVCLRRTDVKKLIVAFHNFANVP